MKRVLFTGLALIGILAANAQKSSEGSYKPFKCDVALGYAIPQGSGSKGGVLFAIEPKYAVMPQLSVGLRLEGAITAHGWISSDGESASAKVATSSSYLATGDYYFNNNTFRPFAGAGLGIYKLASASFDDAADFTIASATKFGGMVRAGFEVGHFRLGLEYNLVGKTTETIADGTSNPPTITSKNGYMGIKFGFFFGGGKN
jgi:outer membrane protein X